jgi:adenylylsulfate kinase
LNHESKISNLHPFQGNIKQSDRHCLNGHRSAPVWFTGLSGSGKSTLAHALEERLFNVGIRSYVLDGDNIRGGLNSDLGLSPKDRKENIRRIAEVAKLMVDAGILVFSAFIAPYRESRRFAREVMADYPFYECYVKCPVEECEKRDPKGLYKMARAGEITNMTGLTAPYEEPQYPELIVDTNQMPLNQCVDQLINFLITRKIIFSRSPNNNSLYANPPQAES